MHTMADEVVLERPLTTWVSCRPAGAPTQDERVHKVTIHPDWSVETPHDLAAEAVASAFGGGVTCVRIEASLAAARQGLRLAMRLEPHPMYRRGQGDWCPYDPATGQGGSVSLPSAVAAAARVRSASHLAPRHRADAGQTHDLLRSLLSAFDDRLRGPGPDHPSAALITEADGLTRLWHAGVHPDEVPRLASILTACAPPHPVRYYLSLAYSRLKEDWLRTYLTDWVPTPECCPMAWEAGDESRAERLDAWRQVGVFVTEEQYGNLHGQRPPPGYTPIAALLPPAPPPTHHLEAVLPRLGRYWPDPPRAEVAVMLAVAGTPSALYKHVRAGARSTADLLTSRLQARKLPQRNQS